MSAGQAANVEMFTIDPAELQAAQDRDSTIRCYSHS
jgi:hypothetical protein